MLILAGGLLILLAAAYFKPAKLPPLGREDLWRLRRAADQARRDELLPFE